MTPEERTRRFIDRLEHRYRTLRDEVEEDVADTRRLDMRARAAVLENVTRTANLQLQWSGQAVPEKDPPADDFQLLWSRLVAGYRKGRSGA